MTVPVSTGSNYVVVVRHQLTFVSLGERKLQLLAFNVKNPARFQRQTHVALLSVSCCRRDSPRLEFFAGAWRRENMVDSKKGLQRISHLCLRRNFSGSL
jgi:hypothetical protein